MKVLLLLSFLLVFYKAPAQSNYKKGITAFLAGNYEQGISFFRKSIAEQKQVSSSYAHLGGCYLFLLKYDQAAENIRTALQADSADKDIFFLYGKYHLITGNRDSAMYCYNKAISLDTTFATAYSDRGIVKAYNGDIAGAFQDDSIAIRLDPNEASYWNDLGYLNIKTRKYEIAIGCLKKSVSLEPNKRAYINLGLAYYLLDSLTDALENYSLALKMRDDPEAFYLRALVYKKLGRTNDACNDLTKSLKMGYSTAAGELKDLNCP